MDSALMPMDYARRKQCLNKTLKFLHKLNPLLASKIEIVDPAELEFSMTGQGEMNLIRQYQGIEYAYHSMLGAKEEADTWFNSLDLHAATVIFIYGIGLGYYYAAARNWLKNNPNRQIVFFERDAAVLHRLFETEAGHSIVKDPQAKIFLVEDLDESRELFNEISWTYFESPYIVTSLKLYQEADEEWFNQLKRLIQFTIEQKKKLAHPFLHYGVGYFRNFYPNLMELPRSYWGNGLFGCFENVPAIICGAGPSLGKNIHLLKEVGNRALIFAGSSALSGLFLKEIVPHFGVAIDPNKEQYDRIASAKPYHIPFFYRGRVFHEALTSISGPRLYLTGAGGYQTAKWFEKELSIEGEDLEEGHSVVNFSIEIAYALGCNPIILVGTDLAFSDHRFYAEGIAESLNLSNEDLMKNEAAGPPLLKQDIYGNPVRTLWHWVEEAKWIEDFAKSHPELEIVNATEGGLGFDGIRNQTLQEVLCRNLEEKEEIGKIPQLLQKCSLEHLNIREILRLIKRWKESLDHCVSLLSKLVDECSRLEEEIKQGGEIPSDLQTPEISFREGELEEEDAYRYLLQLFENVFLLIHHRQMLEIKLPVKQSDKPGRTMKRIALLKEKWIYLRDTLQVNRKILSHTVQHKKSSSKTS